MKINCEIELYEIDGNETKPLSGQKLFVESHWNEESKVVLRWVLHDEVSKTTGRKITVVAGDLISAVQRASGWRRP